jgi:hypothetical protein
MDGQDGPPTCLECGMTDPQPDQVCTDGRDHYVGVDRGCPECGRLMLACARRPCSAMRGMS